MKGAKYMFLFLQAKAYLKIAKEIVRRLPVPPAWSVYHWNWQKKSSFGVASAEESCYLSMWMPYFSSKDFFRR